MKKRKNEHGAVTIFLALILLPCLVLSSLFVDLGRQHVSKSMSESAADLALNTLMTNYDADLSEWYGMAASCQNIQDFYEMSAEFFLRTISSQGLSEDEIILLSDYYAAATENTVIYDLLKIDCTSKSVSAIPDANLANATLLKDQVVEFMKYRAPIELTVGLIDRLNKDDSTNEALEHEENDELRKDKEEYYEAEGDLQKAAANLYREMENYRTMSQGINSSTLSEYATKLNGYRDVYRAIHQKYTMNLANTSGLEPYMRPTAVLNEYNGEYNKSGVSSTKSKFSEVYSSKKTESGTTTYYITEERITNLLNGLNEKITAFQEAKTDYENAVKTLMRSMPGTGENQPYAVQWWVQMHKELKLGKWDDKHEAVSKAAEEMLRAYSKVLAIEDCTPDGEFVTDWGSDKKSLMAQVKSLTEKYLTIGSKDSNDLYLKAVNEMESVYSRYYSLLKPANNKVTVDGQEMNLNAALAHISDRLGNIRGQMTDLIEQLDLLINGHSLFSGVPASRKLVSLDKLADLAEAYENALDTWRETANDTEHTKMGAQDIKEIADIDKDDKNKIDRASVNELKTRLENIRGQFQTVVDKIDALKYGGKKLLDIKDYEDFEEKANNKVKADEIKLTNKELKSYADSTFNELFSPAQGNTLPLEHLNDPNFSPMLDYYLNGDALPALLKYLYVTFSGTDPTPEKVENGNNEKNKGTEKAGTQAEDIQKKPRYEGSDEAIIATFSGENKQPFSVLDSGLTGMLDLIRNLTTLNLDDIRDNLYVTTYMMNMFSYATFENEGKYSLVEEKTELTLGNYPNAYKDVLGDAGTPKTWLSSSYQDAYNKTLTNKMLNATNNRAYGAEVEYILLGNQENIPENHNERNEDNVKKVYSKIYGVRYALNLVSAFKNFWNGTNPAANTTAKLIQTVATSVWSMSGAVIPEPVTKIVLMALLTVFETGTDLDRLQAGFPVELFKESDEEWWNKLPEGSPGTNVGDMITKLMNTSTQDVKNPDKGLYYSDYLTMFIYLGLTTEQADQMYKRMAEVMQANMRQLTKKDNYSMEQARVYFRLKATITVKPLMVTLPMFDAYDHNLTEDTNWCTYTIDTVRGYS